MKTQTQTFDKFVLLKSKSCQIFALLALEVMEQCRVENRRTGEKAMANIKVCRISFLSLSSYLS